MRRLKRLLADRAEVQERLENDLKRGSEEACRERDSLLVDLGAWRDHIIETADKERAEALTRTMPGFDRELGAAKSKMESELAALTARNNAMLKLANERLEEAKWLADTLVESSEAKARAQFDAVRKTIEKYRLELEAMREAARLMLEQSRHAPMRDATVGVSGQEAQQTSSDLKVMLAGLETDCMRARDALERLDRRIHPMVLGMVGIMATSVVVAGLGAGFMLWRDAATPVAQVAQVAGVLLVATGIAMLFLRLLSRQRVPAAASAMARTLGEAQLTVDRCLHQAQADRDREIRLAHDRREQELKEANQQHASVRREVQRRRDVDAPNLREQHQRGINAIMARRSETVDAIEAAHAQRTEEASTTYDRRSRQARETCDQRVADVQEAYDTGWRHLEQRWRDEMEELGRELGELQNRAAALWPAWEAFPARGDPEDLPPAARFGQMDVNLASLPGGVPRDQRLSMGIPERFALGASLDLLGKGSLVLEHPPQARQQALAALNAVMLRLLTTFPPGKVRFTILDPVGLGESFAGFMHLADYEPALVSDRIWTEPRHIEQKLSDLTEHMETVIQKYLRNEYDCIQDYNAEAGEIAEPFRFLVIADFPANFSEAATKRLTSILTSGARCGVFTLIALDTSGGAEAGIRERGGSKRLPNWIPIGEIEAASNTLEWRGDALTTPAAAATGESGFVWRDEDFGAFPLQLESPPAHERLTEILHEVGRRAKDTSRVQVPFGAVAPRDGDIWSRSTALDISVPLGRSGARRVQELVLGRGTAQHALIAGRTGSGKSNLLHVLITSAALWYSPRELEFYLVDFKKGVEFKTYATHHLPHARVIAIESEREFGVSVLRRLDAELTRRGAMFRDAGVQDVAAYRRESGKPMPRILLIVDEFQEFFVEDDKLAQEASLLLDRLVRQGRAFGMHVVLGSQTLGGAYSIARSTIGQMAVRIALQCSESDCLLIMGEDNSAPRLLSRPGEAIYNDSSGMVEGNSPFQVVFLPDEVRDRWVPKARASLESAGLTEPPQAIVFEGNMPARLEESRSVLEAMKVPVDGPVTLPTVWLGEPVSIKDPTSLSFTRQSGSNLLIVGQQDEAALAMMTSAVMSLGLFSAPGAVRGKGAMGDQRVVIFDGSPPDAPSILGDVASRLGVGRIAGLVPSSSGAGGERDEWVVRPRRAAAAVAALTEELDRRDQAEQAGRTESFRPLFVLVYGLHRFRDLRKADDFSFNMGENRGAIASSQFMRLLREGPPLGIHVLAWCDTVANLDRTLERSALREFEARVLFQMSATDSTHLMDTPQASFLGRHRAVLYHEDAGTAERFRPWALPDAAARRRMLSFLTGDSAARMM